MELQLSTGIQYAERIRKNTLGRSAENDDINLGSTDTGISGSTKFILLPSRYGIFIK